MLRKTILAGAAALTLGTAAIAPTGASAWWGGHPRWHGWHHGFYRPAIRVYAGPVYGGGCFAPPGQDALWARAALGQCLLLG